MSVLAPTVSWAQRKELIYLTVHLTDTSNHSIQLESSSFKFSCDQKEKKYGLDLEFLHEIDPKDSKHKITGREIFFTLKKKKDDQPFWNTLTKDKVKPRYIKTDFNHWRDEDDSDYDEAAAGPGGMNMNNMDLSDMMAKMGGAGGAGFDPGDVQSDDSDDEDIPELED